MKPEEVVPWLERFVTVGLQDGSRWEVVLKAALQDGEYLMQPPGVATAEGVPQHVQAQDIIYLATMGELSPELGHALPEQI